MKRVETVVYVADDGKEFKTERECLEYEKGDLLRDIEAYCPATYSDDAGFSIVEPLDVEVYIRTRWDFILAYMYAISGLTGPEKSGLRGHIHKQTITRRVNHEPR